MTYVDWLIDEVHGEDYHFLLEKMHNIDYYWSDRTPIDENRAYDGLELRETYDTLARSRGYEERISGYEDDKTGEKPCSVLEMMVALAQRIEFDTMADGITDRSAKWFWVMITNLNLDFLTDENMTFDGMSYAEMVIFRWLDRRFGSDGRGSPYPTGYFGRGYEDLRETDIYTAFQWYLGENWSDMCDTKV